jgi:hypothetical protein
MKCPECFSYYRFRALPLWAWAEEWVDTEIEGSSKMRYKFKDLEEGQC